MDTDARVSASERRVGIQLQPPVRNQKACIVCRRADGKFTSSEHVFPESLGNKDLVLEAGVVCDRCNNGVLAQLDQALLEFMPIKLLRTVRGIPSKSGRVPITKVVNGAIAMSGPRTLRVDSTLPTPPFRQQLLDDGQTRLQFDFGGGRRLTPRYAAKLSRALLKLAYECAWLDHGVSILDEGFDHVRDAILGAPFDGFFAVANEADLKQGDVTLSYLIDSDGSIVVAVSIYGIEVGTRSRCVPGTEPETEGVSKLRFVASDFRRSPNGGSRAVKPISRYAG